MNPLSKGEASPHPLIIFVPPIEVCGGGGLHLEGGVGLNPCSVAIIVASGTWMALTRVCSSFKPY